MILVNIIISYIFILKVIFIISLLSNYSYINNILAPIKKYKQKLNYKKLIKKLENYLALKNNNKNLTKYILLILN